MSVDFQTIIAAGKRTRTVTVNVPELGGDVTLHAMRVSRKDAFDTEIRRRMAGKEEMPDGWRPLFLAFALADEDGTPLCGDPLAAAEDLDRLPAHVFDAMYEPAAKINGLRNKDIEDAEKNS